MHRKIYRETVAKRIKARRSVLAAQKRAEKAARQAAKAAQKSAQKAVGEASPTMTVPAVSAPVAPVSQSPLFQYISNSLQDFQEGVEVRIRHARKRSTVASPAFSEAIRSTTSAGETAFIRDGGLQARRVSENRETRHAVHFRHRPTRAELINAESSLGRTLFGSIPAGHRREFFHDRENVWIWYERWTEANRESRQITVRYEVRPTGVYKKLAAGKYVVLEGAELENFRRAAHAYLYLIKRNLYHLA